MSDQEYSFYDVWYIRNIMQYLMLSSNPDDLESLIDVVNRPKRYIYGPHIRQQVIDLRAKKGISALDALGFLESLEVYQARKLNQFQEDIKKLARKKTNHAIESVLYDIGYMQYIEEYGTQIGLDISTIQDDIQALIETSESFESIPEFLIHMQNVQQQVAASSNNKNSGLQLMTFHKAKGLEFDDVYIVGVVEEMVPHQKSVVQSKVPTDAKRPKELDQNALEEERRLFYVACTRAKHRLIISAPKQYLGKTCKPSMFIQELMDATPDNVTLATTKVK
jgi:DNA helicase II / ATP-dependent DNA helicase PcrA